MIPEMYIKRLPELLIELKKRMPGNTDDQMHGIPSGLHNSRYITPGKLDKTLGELIDRLSRHYPFHQSFYAGQMLKPPHPAAWLGYALAMSINPNNHALDGGPEASRMEKEVIADLSAFTGFPAEALGHLTSSGTIANLEALWVAREIHPDRPIAISSQSHYTHRRMAHLLRHPVVTVPDGADGYPDPGALDTSEVLPGTVVVTLGTTGTGDVEPLDRIIPWARANGVRIHVDAAYGGFFHLIRHTGWIDPAPWECLYEADSIVIDPHKHGLQPYGCGSVLFRDPDVGRFYKHDSPYTYFTSEELHLGEVSLECSRAGAAAVALWLTLKLLPLNENGLGQVMSACRRAALQLADALTHSKNYRTVMRPELDIVTFVPETDEKSYSAASQRSADIMAAGMQDTGGGRLYLSTLELSAERAKTSFPDLDADRKSLRVLRSVLMKPEHLEFIPEMMSRLETLYSQTS